MLTAAELLVVPPPPVQLSVKVVAAVIADVVTGPPPVAVSLPDHAELLGLAEAVQLVAFCAVHESVTVPPDATLALLAVSATVGAGSTLIAYVPADSCCELPELAGCARTLIS
jgi:hypothetical protein